MLSELVIDGFLSRSSWAWLNQINCCERNRKTISASIAFERVILCSSLAAGALCIAFCVLIHTCAYCAVLQCVQRHLMRPFSWLQLIRCKSSRVAPESQMLEVSDIWGGNITLVLLLLLSVWAAVSDRMHCVLSSSVDEPPLSVWIFPPTRFKLCSLLVCQHHTLCWGKLSSELASERRISA